MLSGVRMVPTGWVFWRAVRAAVAPPVRRALMSAARCPSGDQRLILIVTMLAWAAGRLAFRLTAKATSVNGVWSGRELAVAARPARSRPAAAPRATPRIEFR